METISITQGLAELKRLDQRIEKSIENIKPVAYKKGKDVITGYKSDSDFITKATGDLQSIADLQERRSKIKTAIIVSNAVTNVSVGNKTMTVAEAIETKNVTIPFKRMLLSKLRQELSMTMNEIEYGNRQLKEQLDRLLEVQLGKENRKDSEVEGISKPYLERHQFTLVDPVKIQELVSNLEDEIEDFLTNVDYSLVESNTLTKIEI